MKISKTGLGRPKVAFVACVHGDEKIGERAIEKLKNVPLKRGTLFFVLANEKAMQKDRRFTESDLNRVFPGNPEGDYEERLAHELLKELTGADIVIDIHSTEAETDDFIILTKKAQFRVAGNIPIEKTVFMESSIAKGKALIDHVRLGVSLEFNKNREDINQILKQFLVNLGMVEGKKSFARQKGYSVYGLLKKEQYSGELVNFKKTEFNGELFVPLFYGSKNYEDIACLKARRLG